MRLKTYKREETGVGYRVWELSISDLEMVTVTPDAWDKLLLEECSGKDATIADLLLALEMVVRRVMEQRVLGQPTQKRGRK